eukprot:CAMPEP_0117662472 /NCGR_PEP_ID=MMETSP0804-20121206/8070_1 /TAXON_ID=1074897 /ORGANISM="Tetraselmis astigmatica, Strain CCMP880" /LENGTH=249 /DNA_ID=CAMNT_0005469371 /DNA_START=199 /DNA_END=945 /DNA_ORIENTATION=+
MAVQPAEAGGFFGWLKTEPEKLQKKVELWYKKQPMPVEALIMTIGGGAQGAVLGGVMGALSKNQPPPPPGMPTPPNPAMMGGPGVMARNFAVLTGVNAGLNVAIKKWRGKDDCQTAMMASFGSGVAFSFVSGMGNAAPGTPGAGPIPSAIITGTMFALFQGAFYQIGKNFFGGEGSAEGEPDKYLRTKYMLSNLGLEKYESNFKKGLLDDSTLLLLNERSSAYIPTHMQQPSCATPLSPSAMASSVKGW